MTRLRTAASALLLILAACKSSNEPAPAEAKPAEPTAVAAEPAAAEKAEPVPVEAPAEGEARAAAADAAPAAADDAPDPSSLVGRFAFDWLDPDKAKCVAVDDRMARKLAKQGARCRRRAAGEGFDGLAGAWVSCEAGKAEWLVYADKQTCQEQLETMRANGP